MEECFRCGISEDKATLYKAVHETGIVNICQKCYFKYRLPIIDKKEVNWEEVYKRAPYVKKEEVELKKDFPLAKEKRTNPEDEKLKEIVKSNFNKNHIDKDKKPEDLIDNFNWVIMRKRRMMKMTQKELGEKVVESEIILNALEKGVLPSDYISLIRKIESVLGIRLFKSEIKEIKTEDILREAKVNTGVLVSDVKKQTPKFNFFFKKKHELIPEELDLKNVEEIVGKPVEEVKPKIIVETKKEIEKEEIHKSLEEIKEMIKEPIVTEEKRIPEVKDKEETKQVIFDEKIELTEEEINEIIWGKRSN